MLLACFDFRNTNPDYGSGTFKYQGLADIAKNLGHDCESVSYDGSGESLQKALDKAKMLIEDASAFYLPPNDRIVGTPEFRCGIQKRVEQGARVLAHPQYSEEQLEKWNSFLAPYELLVTRTRIFNKSNAAKDVVITRSPHAFRDAHLFQDVEEVVLGQPIAISCYGKALPLLVFTDDQMPVDSRTDFWPIPENRPKDAEVLPPEWNAREIACMAIWRGDGRGAVLVSKGPGFHDPRIQDNLRLATNIVSFLFESNPISPEQLIWRIEQNLFHFVHHVLKGTGADWWVTRVPLKIREKCENRKKNQKSKDSVEGHLDFIDLKSIMEQEWPLFEPHLAGEGGKKSLGLVGKLNDLRQFVAHPIKKIIASHRFSAEDVAFLTSYDALALKLYRRVKDVN